MDPLVGNAGDRVIGFGVVRSLFGNETLNVIAGVRAAKEKGWHQVNKHICTESSLI